LINNGETTENGGLVGVPVGMANKQLLNVS